MATNNIEIRSERGTRSIAWIAGAIGTGVGIAALAYGRRKQSRWDRARNRASELVDTARERAKPWMAVAAGGAAAGTALAVYGRRRRPSRWQRASGRARDIASRVGTQASPWTGVAVSAAIALAAATSAKKARRRNIRGVSENTAETINAMTERGLRLLQRVRDVSEETRKLYPRLRRVVA